jgi:hypothetical protein
MPSSIFAKTLWGGSQTHPRHFLGERTTVSTLSTQINRQRFFWALAVAIFLLLSLTSSPARADAGPKPGMDFTFEFDGDASDIIAGEMYECDQADCSDAELLPELGPQGFRCATNTCDSIAYGYADYHKIRITFADGRTLESNIFEKKAFNAVYTVAVTDSSLEVKEKWKPFGFCFCGSALLLTLVLETLVGGIYFNLFGLPKAMLGWVPLVSLVTLPAVWYAFPLLPLPDFWVTGLSEGFAFSAEAGLLFLAFRGGISLKHIISLSLLMNFVSFITGLAL